MVKIDNESKENYFSTGSSCAERDYSVVLWVVAHLALCSLGVRRRRGGLKIPNVYRTGVRQCPSRSRRCMNGPRVLHACSGASRPHVLRSSRVQGTISMFRPARVQGIHATRRAPCYGLQFTQSPSHQLNLIAQDIQQLAGECMGCAECSLMAV